MKHHGLIFYPVFILCLLLGIAGCPPGLAEEKPGPPADPAKSEGEKSLVPWVEILGRAIKLRSKVVLGEEVQVDLAWKDASPGAMVLLSYTASFRSPGKAPFAEYHLMRWGTFPGKYLRLVTVTPHAIVFGPEPDTHADLAIKKRIGNSLDVVAATVDRKRNEKVTQIKLSPSLPGPWSGRVLHAKRHYIRCDVENIGETPPEEVLSKHAAGRMLWLVGTGEAPSSRWIAPKPFKERPPLPGEQRPSPDPGEQRPAPDVDLKAERERMDKELRTIFAETIDRALSSRETTVAARRKLLRDALPALKKAVFSYTGHSGPAHAAGAEAYKNARWDLARMLALNPDLTAEVMFPDYTPKTSPDKVKDFRPGFVSRKHAPADLAHIGELLKELDEAKKEAAKHPGRWEKGRVMLGADSEQYNPSDAELQAAEIGDAIRRLVASAEPGELKKALEKAGVKAKAVKYNRFTFRHVDVMGSGRFTYSSGPISTEIKLVP
jgi:hypothetical protein